MPAASLNREGRIYMDGKDSVIIINALGDIPGGKTLDTTGYTGEVINCGHVVVKDSAGNYSLAKVSGDTYAKLDEGVKAVGVVKATVLTANPQVGIMTIGQVCEGALPYKPTDEIKTALNLIQFL